MIRHQVIQRYFEEGEQIQLYDMASDSWLTLPPASVYLHAGETLSLSEQSTFRVKDRPWVVSPGNSHNTILLFPRTYPRYCVEKVPEEKALEELKLYYSRGGEVQYCYEYHGTAVWRVIPLGTPDEFWPTDTALRVSALKDTFCYSPSSGETSKKEEEPATSPSGAPLTNPSPSQLTLDF